MKGGAEVKQEVECCLNCKYCVSFPRNNRYGDIDYFCMVTEFFLHGVRKDRNKLDALPQVEENWNVSMNEGGEKLWE